MLLKIFLLLPILLSAGLVPDYDERCDSITDKVSYINPIFNKEHRFYFEKKAPKLIHQIWFGEFPPLKQKQIRLWEEYAKLLGYKYKLWTVSDNLEYEAFMNPLNVYLVRLLLIKKNWWAASDVLRYEIINNYGGVYIDIDFNPPESCGNFVDFADICSMKGITLMTENHARNIKRSAIFCANGFIISPAHHPFIESLTLEISNNCQQWFKAKGNYNAMMCTGPFFLNRMLSGNYSILPITYLREFKMLD